MPRKMMSCLVICVPISLLAGAAALAYPVASAISLDELAGQADFVFKVEVLRTKPVEDDWFDQVPGYAPHTTEMQVLAVYQGKCPFERVFFHHYAPTEGLRGPGYAPQSYEFQPGRSYIVFAKEDTRERVYRQVAKNHRSIEDQGVVLAADQKPHAGQSAKEVIWRELTAHLRSDREKDVLYGLSHLDTLSGGGFENLRDFDRREVLEAFVPLLEHANPEVVRAALMAIGSRNPYLSSDYAPFWLASVGQGSIHGFGTWDRSKVNSGGQLLWRKLAATADGQGPAAIRGLAIKALGRAEVPELLPMVERWATDGEPLVRAAAVSLLADFPKQADLKLIKNAVSDDQAIVRAAAAQAIGYGQIKDLTPLLEKLLDDANADTARMAAMSLLSFSLENSRDILQRHVGNPQFGPLFVNALAAGAPQEYVGALADIIRHKREPSNWWGGRIPWGVSWEILFRYAHSQPAAKLNGGEFDKVLDALEAPSQGFADGPAFYSSSEPRDLYALYVQRGLTDRARSFRAACKKVLTYDIDYYFRMVDENPAQFQRQ